MATLANQPEHLVLPHATCGHKLPRRVGRQRVAQSRRGASLAGMLLVSALVFVGLAAMAIDTALVTHGSQQVSAACDAAALAGCRELLDRSVLYPHLKQDKSFDRQGWNALLVQNAQAQAISFAGQNIVVRERLELEQNEDNDPSGDVVAGWNPDPGSLSDEFVPYPGGKRLNSLVVSGHRTRARGKPIYLWVGQMLGLASMDVRADSQATLDQRVYGFRPGENINAPVVPLMVETHDWIAGASKKANPGENDRYLIDPITGEVAQGSDRIPEVVVRLCPDAGRGAQNSQKSKKGNSWLLPLGQVEWPPEVFAHQITDGLTVDHLGVWDGELSLSKAAGMNLLVPPGPSHTHLGAACQALTQILGKQRVWVLGERKSQGQQGHGHSSGPQTCSITTFAAGQVVNCYFEDGCLMIVVQPCVMTTPTALVTAQARHNPWVGKLMLTR